MKKLLILILLSVIIRSCYLQCKTCTLDSPYGCTSCNPQRNIYVKSCQQNQQSTVFTALAIVILVVYLIMLALGMGVYRNMFENIQMLAFISWGYGAQGGAEKLQILSLGYFRRNQFLESYGPQFFLAITIIGIFIVLVSAVDRLPHNSIATLIRRKKLIFPLRIQSLIFNIITFSALAQCLTIDKQTNSQIVEIVFSIIALIKQFAVLLVVFYLTNYSNIQIDDQHYYIFVQKLTSVRWYARNNFGLSLLCRAAILVFFVALFGKPQVAGYVCLGIMIAYTIVSAVSLRFVKVRYWVFTLVGNLLTCACIFCMYGCGSEEIGSEKWHKFSKAYYATILLLCSMFLLACFTQFVANSSQIAKQLKSMYLRFIICEKMDDAVELNKYDSDKYRQKVTSFRKNLIYQKDIEDREEGQRERELS